MMDGRGEEYARKRVMEVGGARKGRLRRRQLDCIKEGLKDRRNRKQNVLETADK